MKNEQFYIDGLTVDVDLLPDNGLSDYQTKYIWEIKAIYNGNKDVTQYVLNDALQMLAITHELSNMFGTYEDAVL